MAGTFIETEAVVRRCSVKKLFLEILQNSQENACVYQSPADLVTFTEEILNGKFHFFVQCFLKTSSTNCFVHSHFSIVGRAQTANFVYDKNRDNFNSAN